MARLNWQTPEQAQWQADYEDRRVREYRSLVDRLQIWAFCPRKGCQRQNSCGNERPSRPTPASPAPHTRQAPGTTKVNLSAISRMCQHCGLG